MDYILVTIVAFYIGWMARQIIAIWKLGKIIKHLEQDSPEESEQEMIFISIEKHNEEFFVYDENAKFLAQGKTRQEIESKLTHMFPGRNFACKKDNLKEVGFIQ